MRYKGIAVAVGLLWGGSSWETQPCVQSTNSSAPEYRRLNAQLGGTFRAQANKAAMVQLSRRPCTTALSVGCVTRELSR
jgi:hypothetical protein